MGGGHKFESYRTHQSSLDIHLMLGANSLGGSLDQSHQWFIMSPRLVIASGQAIVLPRMHDHLEGRNVNPIQIQVRNLA